MGSIVSSLKKQNVQGQCQGGIAAIVRIIANLSGALDVCVWNEYVTRQEERGQIMHMIENCQRMFALIMTIVIA